MGKTCRLLLTINLATCCLAFAQQEPSKEAEATPPAIVEELQSHFRFENDGTGEQTVRARLQIRTEQGRQIFGQLFFPFRAQLSEILVRYVRTTKPTGQVFEASPDQVLEVTAPVAQQAPTFSDLKYKVAAVPALQVGDHLEYETTTLLRVPFKPGDFWLTHYPTRQLPVLSERVTVDVPAERGVVLKADPTTKYTVEERDGRRRFEWALTNPKPQTGKALEKSLFTLSSLASWSAVGRWYNTLQADRAVLTPELEGLAQKVVADKKTEREKLEAIYRYVSQSIRYLNISLGLGGYQPHRAAEVWRNQYGDCKDKHTLLAVLLAAIGLQAYPALVNTSLPIEPEVASPGQFDHMISVVPLGEQWLWLDTTQEVAPLGFLPRTLRGKQALVILPNESRLTETPKEVPVPDQQVASLAGEIDAKGTLTAKLRYENRGEYEVIWRQLFRLGNPEQIDLQLRLARPFTFWEASTQTPTHSDPLKLTAPFVVEYTLTQKHFLSPVKQTERLKLPTLLLGSLPWSLPEKESKEKAAEEINLGGPVELQEEFAVSAAPLFRLHAPSSTQETRNFASYESAYELREGKLLARRTLRVQQATLAPSRRAELESLRKAIEGDLDQQIVVERVGELNFRALAEEMTADELVDAGDEAFDKGDFYLARELYEKATQKDPQNKYAWSGLGNVYERLFQFDAAQEAFEKNLQSNPKDDFALVHLAGIYLERDRYQDAIRLFQSAIEANPRDYVAHKGLGRAYAGLERWSEAEAEYQKAISLASSKRDRLGALYIELGRVQYTLGKDSEARASLERALEFGPGPETYTNIAYAMAESNKDLDRALRYAQSALTSAEAGMQLLDSVKNWTQAMIPQTTLAGCLDTLGWVYFQHGEMSLASRYLESAFDLYPTSQEALHLSHLYAKQGQPEKAVRYYAQAVHSQPTRKPLKLPAELETYVREKLGGPEGLSRQLVSLIGELYNSRRLEPVDGTFTWPKEAQATTTDVVLLVCLPDENGRVQEAEVLSGTEPWRSVALNDVKKLRIPPVTWNNRPQRILRFIQFAYGADRQVQAHISMLDLRPGLPEAYSSQPVPKP